MINYALLHDSVVYYEAMGFQRIEVPWTVSEYTADITKPIGVGSYQLKHNNKCLVASAEQSFLYLYLKEFLPKGQFQAITPCFRHDAFDNLHSKYFMKNELIKTTKVTRSNLEQLTDIALGFFQKHLPLSEVVTTPEGFDIVCKGHELGSYGIRECEFLEWIYGTGLAEPRLSKVMNM